MLITKRKGELMVSIKGEIFPAKELKIRITLSQMPLGNTTKTGLSTSDLDTMNG
jgi:hypothetical protein